MTATIERKIKPKPHIQAEGKPGRQVIGVSSLPGKTKRPQPTRSRFATAFLATPVERFEIIQRGIPAGDVGEIAGLMNLPRERLYNILSFPSSTVKRKTARKEALTPEMSARLLGVEKLIGQVEVMIEESGDPTGFDAAKWVAQWIETPTAALGGKTPATYLVNEEGFGIVSNLLARMQSGGYA